MVYLNTFVNLSESLKLVDLHILSLPSKYRRYSISIAQIIRLFLPIAKQFDKIPNSAYVRISDADLIVLDDKIPNNFHDSFKIKADTGKNVFHLYNGHKKEFVENLHNFG